MSDIIKVSGAIVSKNGVTLFLATGSSRVFGAESWRTAALTEAVLVPLAKAAAAGGDPVVEIDLAQFSLAAQIEKATGGAVKVEERIENGVSKVAITAGTTRIEDAAPLEREIERTAVDGSPALANFLKRFAALDHKHTADELLKFVQRMDLPIADDGCIVVYKFLDHKSGDVYADHHTGRVLQRVGSRVSMPIEKTDQSRTQCSSGLHVCSAHYGQYGNSVLLAKVDPADVVAVPAQESGKMRVTSYHLVAKLDENGHTAVAAKKSALTAKGAKGIVAQVIAGNHVGVTEEVVVSGSFARYGKDTATLTVKKTGVSEVPATGGKVREITERPRIDPKQVKDTIKAATSGDMAAAITKGAQLAWEPNMAPSPVVMKLLDGKDRVRIYNVDGDTSFVRHHETAQGQWVSNTRLSEIPAQKPIEQHPQLQAPSPAPAAPVPSLEKVTASLKVERTEAQRAKNAPPSMTAERLAEYTGKLAEAVKLKASGLSLRAIEAKLGMCRKALSKHLKGA